MSGKKKKESFVASDSKLVHLFFEVPFLPSAERGRVFPVVLYKPPLEAAGRSETEEVPSVRSHQCSRVTLTPSLCSLVIALINSQGRGGL